MNCKEPGCAREAMHAAWDGERCDGHAEILGCECDCFRPSDEGREITLMKPIPFNRVVHEALKRLEGLTNEERIDVIRGLKHQG